MFLRFIYVDRWSSGLLILTTIDYSVNFNFNICFLLLIIAIYFLLKKWGGGIPVVVRRE